MAAPESRTAAGREPGQWRYWAFRVAAAVVPRIPYVIAGPAAVGVGLATWAAMPAARRRVNANLAHIPSLAHDDRTRAAAVRGVFCHLALNYVDLFRARFLSEAYVRRQWHLEGVEHYEAARAARRGIILITAHLGNFENATAMLGMFGTPMTTPVERLKPERLFALVRELRSHHGMRTVPADSTEGVRALFAALRRGEVVILAVDRDVLGTGVEVPFFGEPARMPTGAALLAQRSGAPVLWASGYRDGLWRSRGGFVPVSLPGDEAGTSAQAIRRRRVPIASMLVPIANELERQIALHPEQWVAALAPIWPQRVCAGDASRASRAHVEIGGFSP